MAFDRFAPGLVGRPGLRRQLDSLGRDREETFRGLTGDIDPQRFKTLYRRRAKDFLSQERSSAAAMRPMYEAQEEERRRTLHRIQNFGRSPNEILGE